MGVATIGAGHGAAMGPAEKLRLGQTWGPAGVSPLGPVRRALARGGELVE